jgi:N-hydroxyarylamine O-acetyltransferase
MSRLDTSAYLARLGLAADHGEPSAAGLKALHAAHVERVAYEAIEIQLGRPTTVDPYEAAERIVDRHRGGYCYHLNGSFSVLLEALGYDVVWHRAGVENPGDPDYPGPERANHLALTAHGLPDETNPSGDWFVDVGLSDALHEPLPLRAGDYVQGPFRFRLRESRHEDGAWRFDHDPRGSFLGMDFRPGRATVDDFTERHEYLSTHPESSFVRTCCVYRRDARGVDVLKGCVLQRIDGGPSHPHTIDTAPEWYAVLDGMFGLPLTDLDAGARETLWRRVRDAHDTWLTRKAQSAVSSP